LSKSDKRELKGNAKSKNLKNGNRLKEQQNPMEHKKPSNQRDKFVKNQPKFRQYGNQRYQNQEEEEEDVPDIKEELKKENPFVKYVQQKKQEKLKGKAQNAKQSDQGLQFYPNFLIQIMKNTKKIFHFLIFQQADLRTPKSGNSKMMKILNASHPNLKLQIPRKSRSYFPKLPNQ